ncbi:MAG: efflux RND transporter permease subunit [Defluviitaleaceae bacterium]|nr:efflux RND transporter permease subunit [Defluviitaleaceae bacterium]
MLEKLSVRKPFTVLVGVILITVLGVVSLMNTSTDLLPSMDLPYTAVFTTYFGATPEQVERDVTIPKETRMSTLSGIETVQSISNEHVSIMILQFTESTNMDSASLEIREALDMMLLPEGASRPRMIRMNPEMLPIMTANVFMAGKTIDELSEFARYTVAPALEGVAGVAVASLSGLVQNQLHVVIEQERIDAVNAQLQAAMDAMIAAMTEAAMAEAQAQMEAQMEKAYAEFFEVFYGAALEARLEELIAEGYDPSDAWHQAQAEHPMRLHFVNQEIAAAMEIKQAEMMAEMAAAQAANPPQELPAAGLPAAMLSVETIHGMLFAQNFAMPAGAVIEDDHSYMVRVGDRFTDLDEIRNMLLFDPSLMGLAGVPAVRLSDIADVFVTDDSHLSFTRVNGNPAVMISIQRQSEFTTADIASAVRDRMDALSAEYEGLGFAILMDQGEMIGIVIGSVLNSLLWGGLLAIVILLLFLRDIRPTLIVAVSIPVSLLLAFALMYFTGVSLNMISMGGLALAVGMLVDNSIVVIENIYRMRLTTDRSAARAAVSGTKQVAGAIFVASLTTISVFFPIVFTGGITRQLFTDLALTIGYSLMASLIIALTVVPAASSLMLKNMKKDQEGRLFTKFVDGYEKALRVALRFKLPVLILAIAAFAATLWGISRRGMEMFPDMAMGQISVTARLHDDATFEEATQAAEAFSARVFELADVETVGVSIGGGGMMGMMAASLGFGQFGGFGGQSTTISMYVLTEDNRTLSHDALVNRIVEIGEGLELEVEVDGGDMGMGMMMGDSISIRVEGRELDDIRDTAIAVADLIRTVEGTTNVTDLIERGAPELRVVVDKDAAMARGLTVAQVFMAVNEAVTAPRRTINMTLSGRSYEIVVSDGDFTSPDRYAIKGLQIATQSGYVTLSDIATVTEDIGFTSINRMNRNRFTTISGELEEGYNVTLVNAEIERLLADFVPVGNSQIIFGGEAEAIADAMNDLILMLILALVFIYLIMVAQFQSLLSPFIIMLTIPLAFTGGLWPCSSRGCPCPSWL